jgi:hypothetical protein
MFLPDKEFAMTNPVPNQDPMEFLKTFWGNMGFPLPGMITPTLDTDELGRRITDLKAVEGWLKTNLSMLQMTIQGLEMQRATLAAMQSMSQSMSGGEQAAPAEGNPFGNPALWPWSFMPPAPSAETGAAPAEEPKPEASAPKGKPKG